MTDFSSGDGTSTSEEKEGRKLNKENWKPCDNFQINTFWPELNQPWIEMSNSKYKDIKKKIATLALQPGASVKQN